MRELYNTIRFENFPEIFEDFYSYYFNRPRSSKLAIQKICQKKFEN